MSAKACPKCHRKFGCHCHRLVPPAPLSAKDYAKPIGWWCPKCASRHATDIEAAVISVGTTPRCLSTMSRSAVHLAPVDMIPVFEPLAADKREEAAPPDDDDVTHFVADGQEVVGLGQQIDWADDGNDERWAGRFGGPVWSLWIDERRVSRVGGGIGPAVLWVACGVLP